MRARSKGLSIAGSSSWLNAFAGTSLSSDLHERHLYVYSNSEYGYPSHARQPEVWDIYLVSDMALSFLLS